MNIVNKFDNLPIRFKIFFLSFCMILPFLVITSFLFIQADKTGPKFVEKQIDGLEYTAHLLKVVKAIQEHRGQTAGLLGGDTSFIPKLQKKKTEIKTLIASVEKFQNEKAKGIVDFQEWKFLREQTENIINKEYIDPELLFNEHSALIGEFLFSIRNISENSNLNHDQGNSNLLAELIIRDIPATIELIGQTRAKATAIAGTKKIDARQTLAVATHLALIQNNLKNSLYIINHVSKTDNEFNIISKKENTNAIDAVTDYIEFLNKHFLNASGITVSSKETFEKATSTINTAYNFQKTYHKFLLGKLEKRLKSLYIQYYAGISIALTSIIISILIGVHITGKITGSLKYAMKMMKIIADGNLQETIQIVEKSETGIMLGSIDCMKLDLHNIIGQLMLTIKKIELISKNMKESANKYAENSQDQAASAEQTAATIIELTSSVRTVSTYAAEQSKNAEDINKQVSSLSNSIKDVTSSMKELETLSITSSASAKAGEESIKQATDAIAEVNSISVQINNIIDIITEIAQQTDLLALNASIEAARAGDSGRGFSVVAEEISKLSARTSQSAREISDLIKRSGKAANSSSEKVSAVVAVLNKLISSMDNIGKYAMNVMTHMEEQSHRTLDASRGVSELTGIFNSMNVATQEQHHSLEEVSISTQNIAMQTQMISSGADDINDQSEHLSHILNILHRTINKFKIDDNALVSWNTSFLVGVREMDDQHKTLFNLLQEMYNYLEQDDSMESIQKCMSELKDYAVHHLTEEEALMEKIGYPEYANHKIMHDKMKIKIVEFQKDLAEKGKFIAYDIIQFISSWLIHHIREEDTKYSYFINKGSN